MKNRKKLIELTPEWVLDNIPSSYYADGEGNGSVYTYNITDSYWIELALNTIGIKYEYEELGYPDEFIMGYVFRIEIIKDECPSFYKKMSQLDVNNKLHKDQRRLMDLN